MVRSLFVFFVEEMKTGKSKGQTITKLSDEPKIILVRVVFDDADQDQPKLQIGVLSKIIGNPKHNHKFEQLITHFTYIEQNLFENLPIIDYQDNYITIKGSINTLKLFDINSSKDIMEKVITPTLKMYRDNNN